MQPGIIIGIFGDDWQSNGYWLADKLRMGFAPLPGPFTRRKMQLNRFCGLSWLDLANGQALKYFAIVQVQPRQTKKTVEVVLSPCERTKQRCKTHSELIHKPLTIVLPVTEDSYDDAWLSSETTEEMPAVVKLLHERRQHA